MDLNFHGTDDQLEAYVLGRLPDSELTALEEHLLVCVACRGRLKDTEAFAAGIKEALVSNPAAESAGRPRWSAWLTRPVVSMAIGLAGLIVVMSIFSIGRPKFAPVSTLTLTANRGEMPSAVPARELDLTLSDSARDGGVYRVEIVNVTGQTVWSGLAQSSAAGVRVEAQQLLPPGDYFVRLHALSGEVLREYGFRIK